MSDTISTYWAKNVRIKAYRGNTFDFELNVKNEDDSNYEFPEGHQAFFAVYKGYGHELQSGAGEVGFPMAQNWTGWAVNSAIFINFSTTVEDGKISVSSLNNEVGFLPKEGMYHYVLYTYNPDDYGVNLQEIIDTGTPTNQLRASLFPDAFYSGIGGSTIGYYYLAGDEDFQGTYNEEELSSYVINPEDETYTWQPSGIVWETGGWKWFVTNQESGTNPITTGVGLENDNFVDNADVWTGTRLT